MSDDQTVDIIINFIGVEGPGNQKITLEDDVIPFRLFMPYMMKYVIVVDPSNSPRSLVRFGYRTSTIGDLSNTMIAECEKTLRESADGNNLGQVCIFGSSSGGRNALFLARRLSLAGYDLSYVGVLDAAFFPNETSDRPVSYWGKSEQKPPTFRMEHSVKAAKKENYYQTVGNKTGFNASKFEYQWTSDMAGEEIHGQVADFKQFRRDNGLSDDDPHASMIGNCISEVQLSIAGIMNSLA